MTAALAKVYSIQMSTNRPRLRFAPSPNGELHLGHAYSALKTWQIAEKLGGTVLLRIEDIDTGRTRETYVQGIYDDLNWLGLVWEEPVRRQSEHFDDYRAAASKLQSQGLLFPCTATRKELASAISDQLDWPVDPDGAPIYPGLEKIAAHTAAKPRTDDIAAAAPSALRLDMDRAVHAATGQGPLQMQMFGEGGNVEIRSASPAAWGDVVVVRKDTPTSYHLSVVVDDALQDITHVTRGKDLEAATDLHVLLQSLLGLPSPAYHHHDLVADSQGRKLSKRFRDTSLRYLREAGWSPQDVREAVGIPEMSPD